MVVILAIISRWVKSINSSQIPSIRTTSGRQCYISSSKAGTTKLSSKVLQSNANILERLSNNNKKFYHSSSIEHVEMTSKISSDQLASKAPNYAWVKDIIHHHRGWARTTVTSQVVVRKMKIKKTRMNITLGQRWRCVISPAQLLKTRETNQVRSSQ